MGKLWPKYLLFFAPFMLAVGIELALPLDCFTFKVWEALVVKHSYGILNGPFYPLEKLHKREQGDLAHHTLHTTFKDVTWYTDRYGYRMKDRDKNKYDVVIIGDSMVAGSGLTQNDTLAAILETTTGLPVYPLAPGGGARSYTNHPLFLQFPPKIVILERVERNITHLSMPKDRYFSQSTALGRLHHRIESYRPLQISAQVLDRIFKGNMLNFIRALVGRLGTPALPSVPIDGQTFFFLEGKNANQPYTEKQLERTVHVIKRYHDIFTDRGVRFIFLPIPNKESVYYRSLETREPDFLKKLVARLEAMNIETIDTQTAFDKAYHGKGKVLYHADDTHWNSEGVALAAELVARKISSPTSR